MKIRPKLFNFVFFYFNNIKWFLLLKIHGKNGVEVTFIDNVKWLNEKHIETNLGHSNL